MDSTNKTLRQGALVLLSVFALAAGEGCSSTPRSEVETTPWIENGEWLGSIEVRESLRVPRSVRYLRSDCLDTPTADGDRSCLVRLEGRIDASNKVAPLYALEFDYVDGRVSERRLLGGSSYLNAPNACRVTAYRYRVDGYDAVCLDPTSKQPMPRSDGVFSVRVTGDQARLRFEYLDAAGRLMKNGAGFAAAEVVYRGGDLREIRFLDRDNELADAEIRKIRAAVVRYETLTGVADQPFVAEHFLTADGRTEDSNFLANTPAPSMFCEVGLGRNGEPMAPEDCRPLFESATQTNPR